MIRKTVVVAAIALAASACGLNMLPMRDAFYAQHYFLMQDYEREAYKDLSANGKREFQASFWEVRLPSAKDEFDVRMAYINETFRNENSSQPWNTDRARVYLLNGRPANVEFRQNDNWVAQGSTLGGGMVGSTDRSGEDIQATTWEIWSYPFDKYVVVYGFGFSPPNKWKAGPMAAGGARWLGDLEMKNRFEVWGPVDEEAYLRKLAELKAIK